MAAAVVFVLAPVALQGGAMLVDELVFHRRRGLGRWERLGHPLDTASVVACYAFTLLATPARADVVAYAALVVFSSLFITKDEIVHTAECSAGEQWLHALLFVLHPVVLGVAGVLWAGPALLGLSADAAHALLLGQLAITIAFGLYQLVYWNGPWARSRLAR